jgi:hypothetical protein
MLISVCVLGGTELARCFTSEFKQLPYYKRRDSDTEGVRIHTTYIDELSLLSSDLVYRYQLANGNYANVLNDGYQKTKKESSIGNDRDWLLDSNGHDTIVEAVDDADKYLETLVHLIKKGYRTYITSRAYAERYAKILEEAAAEGETVVTYCDTIREVVGLLDKWYVVKLASQRKNILEDSYNAPQCGL